jgi:hypothetical protein
MRPIIRAAQTAVDSGAASWLVWLVGAFAAGWYLGVQHGARRAWEDCEEWCHDIRPTLRTHSGDPR